jgi:hypothetical protein
MDLRSSFYNQTAFFNQKIDTYWTFNHEKGTNPDSHPGKAKKTELTGS